VKRTGIRPGAKSLERNSTFKTRYGGQLARASRVLTVGAPLRGRFTPASPEQRAKAAEQCCRFTGEPADAAHVVPRSRGGCSDPACVIPLTRRLHEQLDRGELDILPVLTREEQAHAVLHLGLLGALQRVTGGVRWAPKDTP
jgi:hypothetical protein